MQRKPVNIHNRTAIEKGLEHTIKVVNAVHGMKNPLAGLAVDPVKALAKAQHRYLRWMGMLNKYGKPHQGAKECARRREQLAKGQIRNHVE